VRRSSTFLLCGIEFACGACDAGVATQGDIPTRHVVKSTARVLSPIAIENVNPGSDGWVLAKPALSQEVEGYASRISIAAGDSVDIKVNVDGAHDVRYELYRIGYYGGHGARLVTTGGPASVVPQAACPVDASTGLVECHWKTTFRIDSKDEWVSGHYLVKLVRDDGFDVYVPFIVREREPRAPGLVQASVTTWQAYNTWGGTSLYHNLIPKPRTFDRPAAFRVSFDRPIEPSTPVAAGVGEPDEEVGSLLFLKLEHPLVSYL